VTLRLGTQYSSCGDAKLLLYATVAGCWKGECNGIPPLRTPGQHTLRGRWDPPVQVPRTTNLPPPPHLVQRRKSSPSPHPTDGNKGQGLSGVKELIGWLFLAFSLQRVSRDRRKRSQALQTQRETGGTNAQ
jgi:hypothetical protein